MATDSLVSLDSNGKPQKVDDIIPESDDEKRRYNEGKERHLERMQRLKDKK